MAVYRIILADDHHLFRAGLKSLIEKESEFQIVAEAQDGEQLMQKLQSVKADLIVLDLSMPHMDGLETLKAIRQKYSRLKVLVLTMLKDPEHLKHALNHGADGYLLKDDAYDQLLMALKMVLKKAKKFISPSISTVVTDHYLRSTEEVGALSLEILTRREKQILKLVAQGLPNKRIGQQLKISIRTVETHRSNLSRKIGVNNTAALVKYALAKGLV